jgi:hypothetical protein
MNLAVDIEATSSAVVAAITVIGAVARWQRRGPFDRRKGDRQRLPHPDRRALKRRIEPWTNQRP